MAVFYTPRFSYTVVKTAICTCPGDTSDRCTTGYSTGVRVQVGTRVGIQGGYTEGYTGVLPTDRARSKPTSEAGP